MTAMRAAVLIAFLSIAAAPAMTNDAARKVFRSPDGHYTALLLPTAKNPQENIVSIRKGPRPVFSHDFSSPDGQHGYTVEKAEWTPDSRFFVFSLVSSGGHSVQNSPTMFYSVERKLFCTLGDYFEDSTPTPQFKIAAPARVTIELLHQKKQTVDLTMLRDCAGAKKK
jgi:hypothetical protein